MAASSVMQSILASPLTRVVSNRSIRVNQFLIIPTSLSHICQDMLASKCVAWQSGPAPKRINDKLAIIGFVAAIVVELSNGQDVFVQISNGGIPWFLGTSIVLTLASLIPLFKGISMESKSDGLITSNAEMWNGRFAMLGLVTLAFTEYVKGGTLI
uniref:Early light-induced protein n=1 Tax=Quercus lobata TaxID=97700 RepID=A0A7N2R5Y7_QUELO